ncbi:MAG: ribonuclease P protein component [Lachnospiraceae bacterium]|nr:ribonuclease P protein component [Lachnospiraceae bacterium]
MRNINSLKNDEFRLIYNKGKSYGNKYLVMYVIKNDNSSDIKLGISVSKKVGNSVIRHRVTRLIRESYRLNKEKLIGGISIIVIGRGSAKDKGYKEIESAFMHLAKLHNILA